MTNEAYFKRYGCIYGASYRFDNGRWNGYSIRFTNLDDAYEWLKEEEYDFRTRELTNKTDASRYKFLGDYHRQEVEKWSTGGGFYMAETKMPDGRIAVVFDDDESLHFYEADESGKSADMDKEISSVLYGEMDEEEEKVYMKLQLKLIRENN